MIDLEHLQSVPEFLVPKGKRLEARTNHHILRGTRVDGFNDVVFSVPRPGEDGSRSAVPLAYATSTLSLPQGGSGDV